MAKCGTCGNKAPSIKVGPQKAKGIRTVQMRSIPPLKPILPGIDKSTKVRIVTKLAERGNSSTCPLCKSALMLITQRQANKQTTYLQCVGTKCDYKRKA